jgi:enterochelin esterase-like enzyme
MDLLRHDVLGKLLAANVLQDSEATFNFDRIKRITEQAAVKGQTLKKTAVSIIAENSTFRASTFGFQGIQTTYQFMTSGFTTVVLM